MPRVSCDPALVRAAVDIYRAHARHVREEASQKAGDAERISTARSEGNPQNKPNSPLSGTGGSHSGRPVLATVEGESLEDLIGSVVQQMEDETSDAKALSHEEFGQLIALIIAVNSADACSQSIEALHEYINDLLYDAAERNPFLDQSLAEKLNATSNADLVRISKVYSALRDTWIDELTKYCTVSCDNIKEQLEARFSVAQETQAGAQKPLSALLRESILDSAEFFTIQRRLDVHLFGQLLKRLTKIVSDIICEAVMRGNSIKFDESSALKLQREVRDVERLIESKAPEGQSTTTDFARLALTMLLINLESPGDLQQHYGGGSLNREIMRTEEIRSVLYSRFPMKLVDCCRIPE